MKLPMQLGGRIAIERIAIARVACIAGTSLLLAHISWAQRAPVVPSTLNAVDAIPHLTISGADGLRSLMDMSGVSLMVDRDAYVVVFAVAPSRADASVQVVSPISAGNFSVLKAGKRYRTAPLASGALVHLASSAAAPVLVSFVSLVRPNVTAFRDGSRWATDRMVQDSVPLDVGGITRAIATQLYGDLPYREVFGSDVPYRVVLQSVSDVSPTARYAAGYREPSECLSRVTQLSYNTAVQQSELRGTQPRSFDNSGLGCSEYSIDWAVPVPRSAPQVTSPITPPTPVGPTITPPRVL